MGDAGGSSSKPHHNKRCVCSRLLSIVLLINPFLILDMTMSMMFCREVQPRILCTDNGTALQLAEVSRLPQNVEFFTCTCADSRPLVLDETYIDYDHETHMKYSCPEFKVCTAPLGLIIFNLLNNFFLRNLSLLLGPYIIGALKKING